MSIEFGPRPRALSPTTTKVRSTTRQSLPISAQQPSLPDCRLPDKLLSSRPTQLSRPFRHFAIGRARSENPIPSTPSTPNIVLSSRSRSTLIPVRHREKKITSANRSMSSAEQSGSNATRQIHLNPTVESNSHTLIQPLERRWPPTQPGKSCGLIGDGQRGHPRSRYGPRHEHNQEK
jgi:hypothetical protein